MISSNTVLRCVLIQPTEIFSKLPILRVLGSVCVLCCVLISGCVSLLTSKPVAPTVSVTRVVPLNLSLSETRLSITLRIENTNDFDLPLQSLDFTAWFAGTKIADGESADAVTIPANGDALLDVAVVAGLATLWDQFKTMFEEQQFDVKYAVTGTAKLANWPTRIPFNVERTLENPTLE